MEFTLTDDTRIYVPDTINGESFDWLGQCSYDELGMERILDEDGDDTNDVRCLTVRADELAGFVRDLYQIEYSRPEEMEAAWERFCAGEGEFAPQIKTVAVYAQNHSSAGDLVRGDYRCDSDDVVVYEGVEASLLELAATYAATQDAAGMWQRAVARAIREALGAD